MKSLFIIPLVLMSLVSSPSWADERKSCRIRPGILELSINPYAASDEVSGFVEEICHVGDHLYVEPISEYAIPWFVSLNCDPSYQIIWHPISDVNVSISCVYSGAKKDRQDD